MHLFVHNGYIGNSCCVCVSDVSAVAARKKQDSREDLRDGFGRVRLLCKQLAGLGGVAVPWTRCVDRFIQETTKYLEVEGSRGYLSSVTPRKLPKQLFYCVSVHSEGWMIRN